MEQSFKTKILNVILVLLGFAGSTSCERLMRCEYGTPTMDFKVSGKVVSEAAAPIPGIKVSCPISAESGTVLTASDGSFSISGTATASSPMLKFEDIDGPENGGEFADKSQEIEVEQVKKGRRWYMGEYEAKDVVISMKEKE